MTLVSTAARSSSSGAGAATLLASTVLGASAATIDFSGISQSYNSLQFLYLLRTDYNGANFDLVGVRLNNDSTVNNHVNSLGDFASTHGLSTSIQFQCSCTGSTAGDFGSGVLTIPRYTGTVANKNVNGHSFHSRDHSGSLSFIISVGGEWFSTAAVTRVTFLPINGANFLTGSAVYLYGIT